jgi:hypothetical protein
MLFTAVLNRVSHSLAKMGVGCRVWGVVNANANGCNSHSLEKAGRRQKGEGRRERAMRINIPT